jgi:uncharacterized protein with PIN domain
MIARDKGPGRWGQATAVHRGIAATDPALGHWAWRLSLGQQGPVSPFCSRLSRSADEDTGRPSNRYRTIGIRDTQARRVKFLCDEMLKRLGRWLRVAGHDVLMLPDGTDDRTLVRRAHAEGRTLLTRDRQMAEQNAALADLVLLDCADLDDCVAALNRQCDIDWMLAPFTRCMNCNAPLVPATDAQRRTMPERARQSATMSRYCPHCDQVFWDGSHVAHMRRRLASWNRRHRGGPPDQHLT